MSEIKETTMMQQYNFRLPEMVGGGEFSNDELAEEMDGLQLNFQRIKVPSGGVLQFELPGDDPEDPAYSKIIEGIILHNHASGAYWSEDEEYDDESIPLCSSVDGVVGMGNPGGACVDCQYNAWGSGTNGKGKACKNMRILYLLRDGDFMPIQLTLPPTSIKPYSDFYNAAFASRRRGTCGSVVQIGLKKANNGKDDYSVVTFRKLYDFTGEQLAHIKAYASGFKAQIKMILHTRAAETLNRVEHDVPYQAAPSYGTVFGNGDTRFGTGDIINGDKDDLPL